MTQRFAGKVAIVTGGTTGIGQATAVRLASEGALVAVNRKPDLDAEETLAMIKAAGGKGFDVAADMRDPDQVRAMVAEVARSGNSSIHSSGWSNRTNFASSYTSE